MKLLLSFGLIFAALIFRTALCLEKPASAVEGSLPENIAGNHAYRLLAAKRTVVLKNGSFSFSGQGNERMTVTIAACRVGELNGDGKPDAAVVLRQQNAANEDVYELSVLLSTGNSYEQSMPVELGRDITPGTFTIEDAALFMPKRIVVGFVSGMFPDTQEQPAYDKTRTFILEGKELKEEKYTEVVKKPALYLYPEQEMTVEVRLGPKGRITRTIPPYREKWNVRVQKNGRIERRYRYLFYEAELSTPVALPEEGWCTSRKELRRWMDVHLKRLGLNREEAKDFRAYWLKNLSGSRYWVIRLVRPEVVEDQLGLHIQPRPRSLLRIVLHFSPSDRMVKLREPETGKFERKGFTVVEWGGVVGVPARREAVK